MVLFYSMSKDLCNTVLKYVNDIPWKRYDKPSTISNIQFRYYEWFWNIQSIRRMNNQPHPYLKIFDELMNFGKNLIPDERKRYVTLRLTKYLPPDDVCEKHRDKGSADRIETILVQLNDSDEYEGGDLFIEGEQVSREQGTAVLLDSQKDWHWVTPITKGVRYSLVYWSYTRLEPDYT